MSQSEQKSSPSHLSRPETQRDRWVKYGANVALATLVSIALAVLVTYAAERHPWRVDTTSLGLYSLKPQTIKIVKNLKSPVRIVSLYTRSKPQANPDEDTSAPQSAQVPPEEAAQTVSDLLHEYANYGGSNITVDEIDPVTSPTKVDALINQVEDEYGGEVAKYKEFVNSFTGTIDQINKIATPEVDAVRGLSLPSNIDQDTLETLQEAFVTVEAFPKGLADLKDKLQRPLKQKPPDYKGAADAISSSLDSMSRILDPVITSFTKLKDQSGVPANVKQYMTTSLPHYQELKGLVDGSLAKSKQLGELKLDTLRSALRERNTILVMGQKDQEPRVIRYDQVWRAAGRDATANMSDTPPKPRFAGEQQVTAAVLAVATGGPRPKVAFVRAGGNPLTQSMSMFGGEAPLSAAAQRLALYNYDVVEKDLTGQFAQMSQGQFPEATDDEIKNATWVVWDFTSSQSNPETGPPPSIAPQIAEHLRSGGSAIILTADRQDALTDALREWGIDVKTNAIAVHEKIANAGETHDILQRFLLVPVVFELHDYGDHPLAKPLNSLDGLFMDLAPVEIHAMAGVNTTPLLPIPTAPGSPKSWGSTGMDQMQGNATPPFDPKADIPGPLNAGVAAEKSSGQRLVVLAAGPQFLQNEALELTAQMVDPNGSNGLLFPANGELFSNSVFWASHQDTLIDISPAAMDVGRIRDISPGMLRFWRVGVLLVGLPLLIIAIGASVYLTRRD